MTINDDHVSFNITSNESWYFDRTSVDATINGFGWTPWFKSSPSVHNLCIERPMESLFDQSDQSLPDVTNDQGLGGYAYLKPSHVVYDWQLRTSDYRFILKTLAKYTMMNRIVCCLIPVPTTSLRTRLHHLS